MCKIQDITGGPSGPTSTEQSIAQQTSDLSRTLDANYQQNYAQQQSTLKNLQGEISRIQSGDTGPGFSAAENAARTGEIVNNADAGARNLAQAAQDSASGFSFNGTQGGSGLERASAVRQQLNEQALAMGETNKSKLLAENTAENYSQGRRNAAATASGLESLAGQYGATAASDMGGTLSAQKEAFGQAEKLHAEADAASGGFGKLIGFGAGLAGKFLTGGMAGGGGLGDFMKGGLGGLAGDDGMFLKNPGQI